MQVEELMTQLLIQLGPSDMKRVVPLMGGRGVVSLLLVPDDTAAKLDIPEFTQHVEVLVVPAQDNNVCDVGMLYGVLQEAGVRVPFGVTEAVGVFLVGHHHDAVAVAASLVTAGFPTVLVTLKNVETKQVDSWVAGSYPVHPVVDLQGVLDKLSKTASVEDFLKMF